MTERAAKRLSEQVDVLELDVNSPAESGRADGVAARALGRGRRGAPRDRVRARGRARRRFLTPLPESASGAFQTSAFSMKALAVGARAADGRRVEHRRARLRCHRRVADLRLDGRRQGRARVGVAVPGPRPRSAWDPREPRLGGTARHGRRARHPGLRRPRRRCGARRRRSGGTSRIPRRSPTRSASCCRTTRARSAARSCTSTAGSTRSALRRRDSGLVRSSNAVGPTDGSTSRAGPTQGQPRRRFLDVLAAGWRLAWFGWIAGSPTTGS